VSIREELILAADRVGCRAQCDGRPDAFAGLLHPAAPERVISDSPSSCDVLRAVARGPRRRVRAESNTCWPLVHCRCTHIITADTITRSSYIAVSRSGIGYTMLLIPFDTRSIHGLKSKFASAERAPAAQFTASMSCVREPAAATVTLLESSATRSLAFG